MTYRLKAFEEADWPRLEVFAREKFGSGHPRDILFHRHWFHTPWGQGWTIRLVQDESCAMSGAMCVIPVRAKFGDRQETLAWISSGAVNDLAKARGAGAQLYFWVYKCFPLVGAMSGNENSLPINEALGIAVPGAAMRRFVRVLSPAASQLCLPGRTDAALAAVRREDAVVAEAVSLPPVGYDALWEVARQRYAVVVERDADYLRWRYSAAPHVRYGFWSVRGEHGLEALAVIRLQRTPAGPFCRVVDFVSRTRDSGVAWRAIAARAQQDGAIALDFMVIGSDQDEGLREAGWHPADATTGLDAVPHLLSPVEYRQWSNTFHLGGIAARADSSWRRLELLYFTKGDSDRDWPTMRDLEAGSALVAA